MSINEITTTEFQQQRYHGKTADLKRYGKKYQDAHHEARNTERRGNLALERGEVERKETSKDYTEAQMHTFYSGSFIEADEREKFDEVQTNNRIKSDIARQVKQLAKDAGISFEEAKRELLGDDYSFEAEKPKKDVDSESDKD